MLAPAGCVRCYGTKCPLLTALFLSSALAKIFQDSCSNIVLFDQGR
jgi:hypothetical protein